MKNFLFLLLVLLAGGCAHLPDTGTISRMQINFWLAAGEYGNALSVLQRQVELHPDDDSLRELLRTTQQRAYRYAQEKIARANELAQKNQWDRA